MPYEYDIFLSYPRAGAIGDWVRDLFHPELVKRYPDCCTPRFGPVFFDQEMERGGSLPDRLAHGLRSSAVIVTVWSPRYFASDWCTAEWQSMRARERLFGRPVGQGPAIVYPVVYGDGDDFPLEARETLQQRCFRRFAHLAKDAPGDVALTELRGEVVKLCEDLARWVAAAPDWQANLPVEPPSTTHQPWRNPSRL
ncbi:TIR domain-containing protein [Myxococcota bacterium]|nr:TIR domain-containing protein [Myxococcota bacterium]